MGLRCQKAASQCKPAPRTELSPGKGEITEESFASVCTGDPCAVCPFCPYQILGAQLSEESITPMMRFTVKLQGSPSVELPSKDKALSCSRPVNKEPHSSTE